MPRHELRVPASDLVRNRDPAKADQLARLCGFVVIFPTYDAKRVRHPASHLMLRDLKDEGP